MEYCRVQSFSALRKNLFAINQSLIVYIFKRNVYVFLFVLNKSLSSANIIRSSNLVHHFRSFINMRKSNSRTMDLWDTLHHETSKLVLWLLYFIICLLNSSKIIFNYFL